jgi:hypothetical protein
MRRVLRWLGFAAAGGAARPEVCYWNSPASPGAWPRT